MIMLASASTRMPGFDGKPTNGMAPARKPINEMIFCTVDLRGFPLLSSNCDAEEALLGELDDYNRHMIHSAIVYLAPGKFAKRWKAENLQEVANR